MSRKVSQSNISAYFNQSLENDLKINRDANIMPFSIESNKYMKCLLGICISGEARFVMLGRDCIINKNQIFCLLPNNIVQLEFISEDFNIQYCELSVSFMKDITSRFPNIMFEYLLAHPSMNMTSAAMDEAIRYFDLIELKINEKYNLFQKDIIFNILFSFVLDMYNMINRDLPNLPLGKTANERIFDKLSILLYHHLKENRPISYYADALNITPKHLSKVVKSIKNISVKQWIDDVMVYEIRQTLIGSQKSIQEISDEFSFSSSDAFHHFFRKHVGVSPSQYRHQKYDVNIDNNESMVNLLIR